MRTVYSRGDDRAADTIIWEGDSPRKQRLRDVLVRMQALTEHDNPGDWVWWWVSEAPFDIPEHTMETLREAGEVLQRFFEAANRLFYQQGSIRRRLEKDWSPNYRRLNDARPDELPRMPRPDVVVDREWRPRFVELEITVCARAETTMMSELWGNPTGVRLVNHYAALVNRLWPGATVGLLCAPHPFWVDLPDDANGFGQKLSRRGVDVVLLTGDELPRLRFDGEHLMLLRADGRATRIDVIDRFIDIYEIAELHHPGMQAILDAYLAGAVATVNTFKQGLDEKEWMAIFWEPEWEDYWRSALAPGVFALLREMIPRTWRLDAAGTLVLRDGSRVPMMQLHELPAARRGFVIKESGTSATSSGAQSVFDLATMSPGALRALLEELAGRRTTYILQETVDSARVDFVALDPLHDTVVEQVGARVKLSPFYVDGELTDIKYVASNQRLTVNDRQCVESVVRRRDARGSR